MDEGICRNECSSKGRGDVRGEGVWCVSTHDAILNIICGYAFFNANIDFYEFVQRFDTRLW